MDYDLNAMSLKELKDLQVQVTRAISGYEDRRKKAALAELEEKARELGFSFAELAHMAPTKAKAVSAPKYSNPENQSETWTGRGRKPRWFIDALAAGKQPGDMAI